MICAASMSEPRLSRRSPSVYAELQVTLLDRLRKQHHGLCALDLEYRRLQRVDLAVGTESHGAPERHDIEFCQLIAHLVAIERAGALNRHLEQRTAHGSRGLTVIGFALVFLPEQFHEILGRPENILAVI